MLSGNLSFPPYIAVCFCFSQHPFCALRELYQENYRHKQQAQHKKSSPDGLPLLCRSTGGCIPFTHRKTKKKWFNKTRFPFKEGSRISVLKSMERKWSLLRNCWAHTSVSVSFRNGLKSPVSIPFNLMRLSVWKSG